MLFMRLCMPLLLLAACGKQAGNTMQNRSQHEGKLLTLSDLKLPAPDNDFPYDKEVVDGHIFQCIREAVPEELEPTYRQHMMRAFREQVQHGKTTFLEWYVHNGRSDTAFYDPAGHLFAKKNNGTLMPGSNIYLYDSAGFLRYAGFYSCTTGGRIYSYHFDSLRRTLCMDVMDSRTPETFGKFYAQVAESYRRRLYTVFFFDTAGYATRRLDICNSNEDGYVKLTRYTYTRTGNPDTVQQVIVRAPASEDYKVPNMTAFIADRTILKYHYHDGILDSTILYGEFGDNHGDKTQRTYFEEGLPVKRVYENWWTDFTDRSKVVIWKYIRYDAANRKRYESIANNRNELLPNGMIRMGY